jgi:ABC-2 type transport system permease protein
MPSPRLLQQHRKDGEQAMTLLSVERIKLFSTRSPYWCLGVVLATALLFALLMGLITQPDGHQAASTSSSQVGLQLGMMVFMVLATLAMTTEYRFGTIRASFLAVPNRTAVLLAKTVVIVLLGAVAAALCGLAAFYLTKVLATSPDRPLELSSGTDWRVVFGNAALFPIAGVIAVAVGTLIRHSAGAISLLLVWAMLLENLVQVIPRVGVKITPWLPFHAGSAFTADTSFAGGPFGGSTMASDAPTPLQGLLVFAGTAVVLWVVALIVLRRRDA